ncbi:MAG: hypothetical protein ACREJK_00850, partial [Candidatus Methylomirabilales bacterium]
LLDPPLHGMLRKMAKELAWLWTYWYIISIIQYVSIHILKYNDIYCHPSFVGRRRISDSLRAF